jgi:hypothetical protein
MASLLEPPTRVHELVTHESGGFLRADLVDHTGDGRQAYRCPHCGTLEYTDSVIAGTCQLCPGLVGLVAI